MYLPEPMLKPISTLFLVLAFHAAAAQVPVKTDTLKKKKQEVKTLSEVTITAKKPVFQREIDRFRFNVAGTDLSIGNTIWGVLEKTPLVTVSEDGALQISGTTGAVVYINNKKKILSGTALKAYLSGLPSDNLEAIEVMTTPSSRYDAEGGAGIINIVTKKNKEEGLIGNAALSTRQTAVNSQAGSLYLNNRHGKWNIFSTVYMGDKARKPLSQRDIFYPAGNSTNTSSSSGGSTSNTTSQLLQRTINSSNRYRELYPGTSLGTDYELNKNHVVGLLFDYAGNWRKETRNAWSRDRFNDADSLSYTNNRDNINSQTYSLNLNYQGRIDSSGKKLSIDFDALEYRSGNKSISYNTALNLTTPGELLASNTFRTASPQKISNQSLKADLDWPINKTTSLSMGLKSSFSTINNSFLFEDAIAQNSWLTDPNQSNSFRYKENINSVYSNWNSKINTTWSYQLGIRLENTISKISLDQKKATDRNYTNLFPAAFLKYTTRKNSSYVLAVSSRITRPGYWDLNPFRTYTTDQAYFEGNPFLLPVKYYREELTHSLNGKSGSLTIQFAAAQTIGEIYALPFNSGDTVINKKTNYGNKYSYTNTVSYSNQLKPWWRVSGTVLTGYVLSKGEYANHIIIDNQSLVLMLSTTQSFTFSKKTGLYGTLILNNSFPSTIVNTRVGNRLDTEIRLRKSAGPFNITLSAQDLLKSNKDRYRIQSADLQIRDNYYNDTRSVALALNYTFGKQTVKDKRERDTGSQDVKGRLM